MKNSGKEEKYGLLTFKTAIFNHLIYGLLEEFCHLLRENGIRINTKRQNISIPSNFVCVSANWGKNKIARVYLPKSVLLGFLSPSYLV